MLAVILNYASAASGLAAAGFWWWSSLTKGAYFKGAPILLEGGRSLAEFLVKSARLNRIAAFLTGLSAGLMALATVTQQWTAHG
jgi:hypothetical protein